MTFVRKRWFRVIMRTLDQIIRSLPAKRRAKVTARTRKLIAEEAAQDRAVRLPVR